MSTCVQCRVRPLENGRYCEACWQAEDIAAAVAAYGPPEELSYVHVARSADRCPLCPEPITEGASRIVRIVERFPSAGTAYDPALGCHRDTQTGRRVRMHRRPRAHADCVERERARPVTRRLTQRKGS